MEKFIHLYDKDGEHVAATDALTAALRLKTEPLVEGPAPVYYLYRPDGTYIGAYDYESVSLVTDDYVKGPAPATALDRFVDGKLIPHTGVFDGDKARIVKELVGSLPTEKLLAIKDFVRDGYPFLNEKRWDVVSAIAATINTDDPDIQTVLTQVTKVLTE